MATILVIMTSHHKMDSMIKVNLVLKMPEHLHFLCQHRFVSFLKTMLKNQPK